MRSDTASNPAVSAAMAEAAENGVVPMEEDSEEEDSEDR